MRKGFTLLELIVVIIIIGILATLGFVQYLNVIERGRTAEAKAVLGTIRDMAHIQHEELGTWINNAYLANTLGLPTAAGCIDADGVTVSHYYWYSIDAAGTGTATRCIGAVGKQPGRAAGTGYTLSLTAAGVGSSAPAGWW